MTPQEEIQLKSQVDSLTKAVQDLQEVKQPQLVDYLPYGANYQIKKLQKNVVSPKVLLSSRDMTAASGSVSIAHGLGKTPTYVKVTAIYISGSGPGYEMLSVGAYDGTNQKSVYFSLNGANLQVNQDTSTAIVLIMTGGTALQTGSLSFNETNINIDWTKVGSPTGTAYLLLEVL